MTIRCIIVSLFSGLTISLTTDGMALAQESLPNRPGVFPAEVKADSQHESVSRKTQAAVPAETGQNRARQKFDTAFSSDVKAASTLAAKQQLASRLVALANENADVAERWVLYDEALALAIDAADIPTMQTILARIAAVFAVDSYATSLDAWTKLSQSRSLPPSTNLVQPLVDLATAAAHEDQFETAAKALKVAVAQARKQRNAVHLKHVIGEQKQLAMRQKTHDELMSLRRQLAVTPNDRSLNTKLGKLYCFRRSDWAQGLPPLAKGSDAQLATLAAATLALTEKSDSLVAVGDGWWNWGETQDRDTALETKRFAATLFREALPTATGLERAALEKRIAEAGGNQPRRPGTGKKVFLADLPAPKHTNLNSFSMGGTYGGMPIKCQGKPSPKAIVTVPKLGTTASLATTIPPEAVAITGAVSLFTIDAPGHAAVVRLTTAVFFEIHVDGVRVWRSPAFTDSKEAAPFDLPLTAARTLELRVVSDNPNETCLAAWLDVNFVM